MRRLAVVAAAVILSGLFLAVALTGPAASNGQPEAICGVCGAIFHENVTGSEATLRMTADGDVHWKVENELRDPTATKWRENPDIARSHVEDQVTKGAKPDGSVENLTVEMEGDTVKISFVEEGASRHRLGLLILAHFHREGFGPRLAINADRLTIVAPEGQRIVNNPQMATVKRDRVVWTGIANATYSFDSPPWRTVKDTYVVTGTGPTAQGRATIAVVFEPLDSAQYTTYAVGLLFFTGLAFGIYTLSGHRLGSRRVLAGMAVVVIPYLLLIAAIHPPKGGLGGFVVMVWVAILSLMLSLASGIVLYVLAGSGAADQQ